MNRLALQQQTVGRFDKSAAYSSYVFGDPATPIARSYLGDPVKQRVVHGGSEVFHVHHVHGGSIRWRRQPGAEPTGFDRGWTSVLLAPPGHRTHRLPGHRAIRDLRRGARVRQRRLPAGRWRLHGALPRGAPLPGRDVDDLAGLQHEAGRLSPWTACHPWPSCRTGLARCTRP